MHFAILIYDELDSAALRDQYRMPLPLPSMVG
jgi:hypothetical protein